MLSIFKKKCPRCRKGDLFTTPFSFSKPLDMPKQCQECGLIFEPEPGFYFGAMFLSYGIYAVTITPAALLLVLLGGWSVGGAMALVLAITFLTFIWMARLARSLWIHIAPPK